MPLFVDPHLENFGAVPDTEGTIFDGTDFDSTVRGPFDRDLRRAALGLGTLDSLRSGRPSQGNAQTIATWVGALYDGYGRGLSERGGPIPRSELGAIVTGLLDDADQRLTSREDLSRYTRLDGGARRILRSDQLVDPVAPWDRGIDQAVLLWASSRRGGPLPVEALVVKDVARRLGAGVASLSAHRYYVLLEGAPGPDDDLLIELKESRDPPVPAQLLGRGTIVEGDATGPLPADNAARVLSGANRLLSSPSAELDFGRTSWNGVPFFVRSATRGDVPSGKSWARLPDGTGAFATATPTQLAANMP